MVYDNFAHFCFFLQPLFNIPSLFLPAAATTPVAFKFARQVENYLLGQLGANTGNKQDHEQQGQRLRGHHQRVEVLVAAKVSSSAASRVAGGGPVKNNLEQLHQVRDGSGIQHQGVRGGNKLPSRGARPKSSNRRKRLRAATEPQPEPRGQDQETSGCCMNPTTLASNGCRVTQDETRDHAQRSHLNHKNDPSGSAAEVGVDLPEQQSVAEEELPRSSSSPPARSTRSTVSFCDVASHVLGQDLSSFLTIQDLGRLSAVGKNFVTRGRSGSGRSSGNTTPSSTASSTSSSRGPGATPRSTSSQKNREREPEDETCPDSTGLAALFLQETYKNISEDEHSDPITGTTRTIADHYNIQEDEDVDCDNISRASTPCSVKTSGKARHIEETAASTRACLVETLFALSLPEVYTEARRPGEVNAEGTVMDPPVVEPCLLSCHDHLDHLTGKMEERCAACYKLKPWMVVPTKAEFMAKARIHGVHGKGYEGGVHGIVPPPPPGWTKTPPHTSEVAPGVFLADENTQLGARPVDAKKRQALFQDYPPFQHNQEIKLLEKQLETWSLRSR
eukprot:GSA120T00015637001.1